MGNPYFSLLSISWKYGCNVRPKFVLVYVLYICNNILVALHPLLYAWFIDHLQREGTKALYNTWIYIAGFLVIRLLEWAFHGPARIMERQLAFRISANFMQQIYTKVLHLPVQWHREHHSGDTINRIRKSYEALKEFFQGGFIFLHTFCKFFFSFAAMLYFAPLFGFIALLLGIFSVWVMFRFDKPFVKTLEEVNRRENMLSSSFFDSLSNIITVITLRLEKRMIIDTTTKLKKIFPPFKKNVRLNEMKWFTGQMLIGLIFSVTILGYVYQHYQPGQMFYIGGLVALLTYVNNFTSVFNDVAFQYTRIIELHTNTKLTDDILEASRQYPEDEFFEPLPKHWSELYITDLNYNHIGAGPDKGFVKDITLNLAKGRRIALIGESGSGKSTILGLIRGLQLPDETVKLVVDGNRFTNLKAIADNVTLFPQDPEIFENTIRYNITLGLPFTEEQIRWACHIAQFTDVIQQLPCGLDSNIQEKGVNLSGGQKQRLALARGILTALSNDILLLDEPTSSVDPKTEGLFYQNFFAAFPDRIIVSSLHRLHLLPHFDYIYVLDKGRIVEEGDFRSLQQSGVFFQEMWKHQEQAQNAMLEMAKAS